MHHGTESACVSFFFVTGLSRLHRLIMIDGVVKSPISALRFIPRYCGVPYVCLIPRDSRRLELELFSLPSLDDFLRVHHDRLNL
jgi:hypothetical protein